MNKKTLREIAKEVMDFDNLRHLSPEKRRKWTAWRHIDIIYCLIVPWARKWKYIGQTFNIGNRLSEHRSCLRAQLGLGKPRHGSDCYLYRKLVDLGVTNLDELKLEIYDVPNGIHRSDFEEEMALEYGTLNDNFNKDSK